MGQSHELSQASSTPHDETDPLLIEGQRRWEAYVAEKGSAGVVADVQDYLERAEANWAGMLPPGAVTNLPWSEEA